MRQIKVLVLICMSITLIPFLFSSSLLAQDESNTGVQLEEAAICRNVEDRTPIGRGSIFHAGVGRLYCFTKVIGAQTDTTIIHHWYLNGKLKASVTLPVRSAAWRTWSSKDIMPQETGDWMVEVLTAEGDALESILFLVQ
jgi:Protein of unknown function (DUF2914)